MKTLITLVLTVLFSTVCVAQNGINYKAIIKDNLGNVVASQSVTVQFSILKGVAQTNQYTETHTKTTDANGILIVNIGEGTQTSGNYSTIDWGSDVHFLNTQINTGAGLVDMGTTEFKTVPYAINAKTATFAANVSGLEALDEGYGFGWRLKGRNPNNYGNLGQNAVDFSNSSSASLLKGARGFGSMAIGINVEAEGNYSLAQGGSTKASGLYAVALGFSTVASGPQSIAMGGFTNALSTFSTAFGYNTISDDNYATVIGKYNDNTTSTTTLFQVGNGTSISSRSNALNVLDNGTITAPSFDLSEITTPKALITKEYADTNLGAKGLEALNEGNGIGWRLKGRNPSYYGSIGLSAVDLSYSSGSSFINGAIGDYSISMGENTSASGQNSVSMGENTYALGQNSIAMGFNTRASSYASVAIGKYNVGGGSASTWVSTDPIFEVGFGGYIGFPVNNIIRLNSFTILKNGNVGIGTSTPSTSLQIAVGDDASYSSDSGYLVLGSTNGSNLVFDQNEIIARNNGAASPLFLQQDGGDVRVGGVVVHSSDFRLKKDITPLNYGLETILELNPVEYNWKNREQDHKSLGLIAQEVQPILENIVHIADDEDKTLSVSYTELIPVLIKAIKDQHEIIKNQAVKINGLTAEAEEKDKTLKAFDSRLKQIESVLNQTHQ